MQQILRFIFCLGGNRTPALSDAETATSWKISMKPWTKSQVFTSLACIVLLVITIPIIDINSIIALHSKGYILPAWIESFRLINGWFYYLYQRCLFLLIAIVILINRSDLKSLNIDKYFIRLFAYSGLAYCWMYFWPLGWAAGLISVFMLILYLKKGYQFGDTNPNLRWIVFIIVIGFILSLFFIGSIPDSAKTERAIHWLLIDFPPFAVMEEVIFRGLPWMVLKKLNWSETWIVAFQAVLFWLSHTTYFFTNPMMFWGIVPIASLLLGSIAWRSRSIAPSAVAHILFNVLLALMQTFR